VDNRTEADKGMVADSHTAEEGTEQAGTHKEGNPTNIDIFCLFLVVTCLDHLTLLVFHVWIPISRVRGVGRIRVPISRRWWIRIVLRRVAVLLWKLLCGRIRHVGIPVSCAVSGAIRWICPPPPWKPRKTCTHVWVTAPPSSAKSSSKSSAEPE